MPLRSRVFDFPEKMGELSYTEDMTIDLQRSVSLFPFGEGIFRAAVRAVMPDRLLEKNVIRRKEGSATEDTVVIQGKSFDLSRYERIFLAAFGKAAPRMAETLAGILGNRLTKGIVVSPEGRENLSGRAHADLCREGRPEKTGGLEYIKGSHPLPDDGSVEGARRILELAGQAGEKDLVFVCISGGGSALLCLPARGVNLREKRQVTRDLLNAGAAIGDLNAVRKHLSAVKGGRLAKAAFPATVINLVISDVLENDLGIIASGPTHWDSTTFGDAGNVLEKFHLWKTIPAPVRDHIERGVRGDEVETVKEKDPVFERVHTFIVGDNMVALRAAKSEAERLGFETLVLSSTDHGEAREAASKYASFLASMACSARTASRPLCFLAGGELTVEVTGKGRGGRNTEFVLASLLETRTGELADVFCGLGGAETEVGELKRPDLDWLILSMGTDGVDGPTDAAGAWVEPATLDRIEKLGLDPQGYLDNNDSYSFFKRTGNLVVTGPTGTNVMDIRIFLLGPA